MINSVDMDLRNDNKISLVLKDKTGFMKSTLSHIQNSLKSLAIKIQKKVNIVFVTIIFFLALKKL